MNRINISIILTTLIVLATGGMLWTQTLTAQESAKEEIDFTTYIEKQFFSIAKYELIEYEEGAGQKDEPKNKDKAGFEVNKNKFNDLMKCVFTLAKDESEYFFASIAKKKLEEMENLKPLPEWEWPEEVKKKDPPEECEQFEGKGEDGNSKKVEELKDIIEKQKENGFTSMCKQRNNPLVAEPWHYCKVSEIVLNELFSKEEVDLFSSNKTDSNKAPNGTEFYEVTQTFKLEGASGSNKIKAKAEWEFLYENEAKWTREAVLLTLQQYQINFRNYLYKTKYTFDLEWAKGLYCRYELISCWTEDAAFGPYGRDRTKGRFFNPNKQLNSCEEGDEPKKKCNVSEFCKSQ